MYLTCTDIEKLILKFKKINNRTKFIIGISKQNFLSKLLMFITNNFNAHHGTLSTYLQQKAIIQKYFKIINQFNIYGLTTVFFLEFK